MSKSRILIVDDDHNIIEGAAVRLRSAGFETLLANDGAQAVQLARCERPDAIVMDVRMPVMDGLTAINELKLDAHTVDIPVVVLSASILDEEAALDAGARFFVRKPFDGRTLVEAIETATGETKRPSSIESTDATAAATLSENNRPPTNIRAVE